MDNRPLFLIDVDGVLNVTHAKPTRRPEGYTTHRLRPTGWERAPKPLRLWLNPDHGALLLKFAAEHDVELIWATTWMEDANKMIGPIVGLPDLRVIDYTGHPGTIKGWKYPATLSFAEGRSLFWVDDDFGNPILKSHRDTFMEARRASGLATKLHHVDPAVGLTSADLDLAGKWLDTLKESND